jgi:hypothetical protein
VARASFYVFALPDSAVVAFGTRFGQNAIVWIDAPACRRSS